MRITVLCSSPHHPVNAHIARWQARRSATDEITVLRKRDELVGGDVLLLISCGELIGARHRALFRHTFVLHASDLPKGRGWNPHIWAILEGATEITVSMLEAEDKVDSGAIWGKRRIQVPKHWLWHEVNEAVFHAEFALIDDVLDRIGTDAGTPQPADEAPTYYRLRQPEDSRLDANASIASQFDLLRICDPERYPAFFDLHGHRFTLRIERIGPVGPADDAGSA